MRGTDWLGGAYAEVSYHWQCSVAECKERLDECRHNIPLDQGLRFGLVVHQPEVPAGWRILDGGVYCPQHRITVEREER